MQLTQWHCLPFVPRECCQTSAIRNEYYNQIIKRISINKITTQDRQLKLYERRCVCVNYSFIARLARYTRNVQLISSAYTNNVPPPPLPTSPVYAFWIGKSGIFNMEGTHWLDSSPPPPPFRTYLPNGGISYIYTSYDYFIITMYDCHNYIIT